MRGRSGKPLGVLASELLAEHCGLFRTCMSRIETGRANPSLNMIHALTGSLRANVLGSLLDGMCSSGLSLRSAGTT